MSYSHERDLGTLNLGLFQEEAIIRMRVLELTRDGGAVAHNCPGKEEGAALICPMASDGHLRWARPSPLTRPSLRNQRDREVDEVINHPALT